MKLGRWENEVTYRLEVIYDYKKDLLRAKYMAKILSTVRGIGRLEGRRAPAEMLAKVFSFMNKPMNIILDERKAYVTAFGKYTRKVMSSRGLGINHDGYWIKPEDDFCREFKAIVTSAEALARQERYAKTGRIDDKGLGSYVASIQKLGWINCDRFTGEEEVAQLTVQNVEKNTRLYLVFKDIRSILRPIKKLGVATFSGIPDGAPVKLVGVRLVDEKPQMAVMDMVVGLQDEVTLTYGPCKLTDLSMELNSVDPVSNISSVETLSLDLTVFPNPTSRSFTAEVKSPAPLSALSLYDMQGALIRDIPMTSDGGRIPVSVSDMEDGTYVVTATTQDGRISSEQLVIQN